MRRRPTNIVSRDVVVKVDRDAETDSDDPKKKKKKVETGWRDQAPNVIAVVSLLLNLAVTIPFGYLNFWGSKTAEKDASRASTVAAKLARWQNCIDYASHPVYTSISDGQHIKLANILIQQVRDSLWCGVYTSEDIPLDYMLSDTGIQDAEYTKAVHALALQHYIKTAGFAAMTGMFPLTLQVPSNIRNYESNYAVFCAKGVGLSLLENIPDISKGDSTLVVGNFSAVQELNPSLEVYPGFEGDNCKVIWGSSIDMTKHIMITPPERIDPVGKGRWMAAPAMAIGFPARYHLQEWHIFMDGSSWAMREMERAEKILGVPSDPARGELVKRDELR